MALKELQRGFMGVKLLYQYHNGLEPTLRTIRQKSHTHSLYGGISGAFASKFEGNMIREQDKPLVLR